MLDTEPTGEGQTPSTGSSTDDTMTSGTTTRTTSGTAARRKRATARPATPPATADAPDGSGTATATPRKRAPRKRAATPAAPPAPQPDALEERPATAAIDGAPEPGVGAVAPAAEAGADTAADLTDLTDLTDVTDVTDVADVAPAAPARPRARRSRPAAQAPASEPAETIEPSGPVETAEPPELSEPAPAADVVGTAPDVTAPPAKRVRSRRRTAADAAAADAATSSPTGAVPMVEEAPPTKTAPARRRRAAAVQFAPPATEPGSGAAAADDGSTTVPSPPPVVMFQAPEAPAEPARRRRTRPSTVATEEPVASEAGAAAGTEPAATTADAEPADAGRVDVPEEDSFQEDTSQTHLDEGDDESASARRRRRRGRRGRGRGRVDEADDGGEGTAEAHPTTDVDNRGDGAESSAEHPEDPADDEEGTGSRRRRRRRRRGGGSDDADVTGEDPPNTVVRVRQPRREPDDEVRGLTGSTRLEAKRQRRREGRDQGRRRPPIVTESEFLARREAVDRVMVVRQTGDRTQVAVLEDDVLVEHYVTRTSATSYVGNVYLGRVQNVLPSMEAAFVDIGKGRNAVLYAGEVNYDASGLEGRPQRIEQALKGGQVVLVQVTKDPIGHKGSRLTSQVSLPGRFLVYVPDGRVTGISRKLPDNERSRLKSILKKIMPEGAGVIVRTAAEGASEDDLRRDVDRLQAQWESIQKNLDKAGSNAPTLLYAEPDLVVRVIRDIFNEDFKELVVQGDSEWDTVESYVEHLAPDLAPRLSHWARNEDVFSAYRVDEQLTKALDRKVWLPSGGSLVIDRTEAMVVVDVNTGKFTGKGGNLEETVTKNNLEAAEEIVRQLRLRDLGGIIVIDFIDMVLESNRELVLRRLMECLGRDRTKHQVAEVTSLGLVQMTRKRVGQGLLEAFSEQCPECNGRGVKVHMDHGSPAVTSERPYDEDRPDRKSKAGGRDAVVEVGRGGPGEAARGAARVAGARRGRGAEAGALAEPDSGVPDILAAASEVAAAGATAAGDGTAETVEPAVVVGRGRRSRSASRPQAPATAVGSTPESEVVAEPAPTAAAERQPEIAAEQPEPAAAAEPGRRRRRGRAAAGQRDVAEPAGPAAGPAADASIPTADGSAALEPTQATQDILAGTTDASGAGAAASDETAGRPARRRRRAASRPAGPPAVEDEAGADGNVREGMAAAVGVFD